MTTQTGWVGVEHLLTAQEAAATLGVSKTTVARLRRSGRLAAVGVGGVWRFDPADVRAFIDANRTVTR